MSLAPAELRFLDVAARYLERPSFLLRVTNLIGEPVERAAALLPQGFHDIVRRSLFRGLEAVVRTVPAPGGVGQEERASPFAPDRSAWLHTAVTGVTGGVGGLLGGPALAIELPLTTALMLRSIAVTARNQGEDLSLIQTRIECLSVLSYGGPSPDDDAMENAYYTSRIALGHLVRDAAQYLTAVGTKRLAKDLAREAAPPLVALIGRVAGRFNLVVTDKLVAQAVPVVGAVGGAALNVAFTTHFNRVAGYHFGIRRLERQHGETAVRMAYENARARALPPPPPPPGEV